MMNLNRGYEQYKQNAVMTMTHSEMLLLLYDEMLKRLMRAEIALEKPDYELFGASIKRCKEIVYYLKRSLNYQYSISRELRRMYDFFLYELSRIEAGRRKEVIVELKPLVRDLRDAFEQAGKVVND